VIWQAPVDSSGAASCRMPAMSSGSHTITAVYASDTNFAASSGSMVQKVQSLHIKVSSAPNPSVSGQSVTFTAAMSSITGTPSGTVTFTEGATVWASDIPVDGTGHAAFSTTALVVGSHILSAAFTGTAGWTNISGIAPAQTVKKATVTVVSSSVNPSVSSQSVTFTATVTATVAGGGIPTGTVTFKDGATTLGSVALSSGSASLKTAALSTGKHNITVVYSGTTTFMTSTSAILVQTVN